ncbi:MAG: hypothetical protein HUU28_01415 [Planctomycetaceae bacterium]|jgi:hypothetical protein|nr:hypothetical protein [Planctomycetaceae bacterium]
MRHFTPVLLGLCLLGSCAAVAPSDSLPASAPAIEIERAPWIRSAHAQVVDERLEVELLGAIPALQSRRGVTVEAVDATGQRLFSVTGVASLGTNDARYHRSAPSRLSLALPQLEGVAALRVVAGR